MRLGRRTIATIAVGGLGCLAGGLAGRQLGLDDDAMFLVMVAVLLMTSLADRERFWGRPSRRS